MNNMLTVSLLGKYGAWKTTHSQTISDAFWLSVLPIKKILDQDDIVRQEFLWKKVLIPDEHVFRILNNYDLQNKVLDWFPRTVQQAQYFLDRTQNRILCLLDIDDKVLMERQWGRLICDSCTNVYSSVEHWLMVWDACPRDCDGTIQKRPEDQSDFLSLRKSVFDMNVSPTIDFLSCQIPAVNIIIDKNLSIALTREFIIANIKIWLLHNIL